jgi:hypothetical protein
VFASHRPSLVGSAVFAGLLVAGLGACSDEPERNDEGEVTEGGDADVLSLNVGDCISDSGTATTVGSLPVVPCDEPHDSEVYFSYMIPGDEIPAEAEMNQIISEQCTSAFETFIGMPYEQSVLDYTSLFPTAGSWDQGDREVLCMAVDPAGDVTGTLEGVNR